MLSVSSFFVVSIIGLKVQKLDSLNRNLDFGGKCMVGIRSAGKTNLVLPARILHTAPLSSEQALLSCYSAKSSFMSSTAEYATDVPGPNMAETPAL